MSASPSSRGSALQGEELVPRRLLRFLAPLCSGRGGDRGEGMPGIIARLTLSRDGLCLKPSGVLGDTPAGPQQRKVLY